MFAALTRLLRSTVGLGERDGPAGRDEDPRQAACALLLELAYVDADFSRDEQACVRRALHRQFGLRGAEAQHLLDRAAALRDESELAQLTARVAAGYSPGQIRVLTEIMGELTRSDGLFLSAERYLLRKLCFLLRCDSGARG